MKRRLETLLGAVFVLATIGICCWANMTKQRVLVLFSYDLTYSWCQDETIGIKRVLDEHHRYSVRWHYMDAKRHPWKDYLAAAGTQARRMINEWHPDVILAADDEAQQYAVKYYANRPGIAIVFLGLNGAATPYGYDDAPNVTGIFERFQLDAVRDAVEAIAGARAGAPLRVLSLSDQSEAAETDDRFVREFDWAPLQFLGTRAVRTLDAWKEEVNAAEGRADFIVAGNYRQLERTRGDRTLVPPQEVVEWTEAHSKVPVIGIKHAYAEEGGLLAIGASGYEQGERAAEMAVEILDRGTRPHDIPFVYPRMFLVSLRGSRLKARGIALPSLYEAAARAAGKYYD